VQQTSRTLDVREEEGDRASRQLVHGGSLRPPPSQSLGAAGLRVVAEHWPRPPLAVSLFHPRTPKGATRG
jgi:hypothetical protein